MSDKYVLDKDGNPRIEPNLNLWAKWFETGERQIEVTFTPDGRVSTVFLGLDHSFGHGAPLLWETMIFGGKHDGYQDRYSTRADAVTGHAIAVKIALGEEEPV